MTEAVSLSSPSQQPALGRKARRWAHRIGVTAAVAVIYFLVAELGLGLYGQTNWVSVFWPPFGISAGILIALGSSARLQVATGVIAAILVAHVILGDPRWLGPAFAISDAAEALVTAELIWHFFGAYFDLGRLRHVLGLFGAAIVGSIASFTTWILLARIFQNSTEPLLTTWQHWFMGDMVGFVALGPFVIGLFAAMRQPPGWRELIDGVAGIVALALVTAIIVLLPNSYWETLLPVAWLFPMLFWLAARCRPVFAAAGAFIVSIAVVWTTVYGIGHFGNSGLAVGDRNLQAQVMILVVALGALVLSALFVERRQNENRLARSNETLQRERDSKLVNAQAITASIVHELKQPLTAIVANASAAIKFLETKPPDYVEVHTALGDIIEDAGRANETMEGIRAMFRSAEDRRESIDVNEVLSAALRGLREEMSGHHVTARIELTNGIPLIRGNRHQLREVFDNLIHNAIEAMDATKDGDRNLWVRSEIRDRDAIAVSIRDTGPGIDPFKLDRIFDAFFTTKEKGMGLGLAICRLIAEHHGGQLTASSDGKDGALFQFVLPVKPV
jgi:signal transduction histidine kinase